MLNVISGTLSSGAPPVAPNSYESIATVTVGSGGSASIDFTSISSAYKHLQIRGINRNETSDNTFRIRFNSDSGSNYSRHFLYGDGSTATAAAGASTASIGVTIIATSSNASSIFSGFVIDILDYANTSKYKTVRSLGGYDANGSGYITLTSGVWMNTAAVTSITLISDSGDQNQYSSFALYGIKG